MPPDTAYPPLSSGEITKLTQLVKAVDSAADNDSKGKTMEAVAEWLFNRSKCFESLGSKSTATGQIDHVIRRVGLAGNTIDDWSRFAVGESKNWASAAPAKVIRETVGKAENIGADKVVVFSKLGVTGKLWEDAQGQITASRLSKNIYVLVFDRTDLDNLCNGMNFVSMLLSKDTDLSLQV